MLYSRRQCLTFPFFDRHVFKDGTVAFHNQSMPAAFTSSLPLCFLPVHSLFFLLFRLFPIAPFSIIILPSLLLFLLFRLIFPRLLFKFIRVTNTPHFPHPSQFPSLFSSSIYSSPSLPSPLPLPLHSSHPPLLLPPSSPAFP